MPNGNSREELSQNAHDNAKAMEWGDKALSKHFPNDLDIVVSDANVAMAMKDNGKIVDYAVKGAAVCHSIPAQEKPGKRERCRMEEPHRRTRDCCQIELRFSGNCRLTTPSPPSRPPVSAWNYIEKFTPAFPKSQFEQQVSQLAMYSLQQLNQPQRLAAYGEKALAANPDSVPTLLMLANAYAGDPKQAAKAATCANKVIALVGPNPGDDTRKSYAGLAHTALGRAELNQEKLPSAVTELKAAVALLQHDPPDQQVALYYLGYACAKQNRKADSVAALEKAAAINGPYHWRRRCLAKCRPRGRSKRHPCWKASI